ncbi:sensor histidine kinase [Sediminibacillus dalangtanensis]|uniref:histidine kinase n=1 Tax=Sediminibacillus dalangtanensis TaxID=2729421 RepID=A0ABX7VNM4_9BACI|nr:HAMP domain-containing sensor histidine kinase [Sediminibacillus dalangtanensis]QTM98429.1 sensor histidine kinase [Sediminibacillus dalangtanensis]
MLYGAIILTGLLVVYLLARQYLLKKEIKRIAGQLRDVNEQVTEKKVDIRFFDNDVEKLAKEINNQIDRTKHAKADKRKTENELKQAVSYISHDIRTPMTTISGYLQFLESDQLSAEEKKEYIETIKKGVKRLKVLLEDFFELSIIEQADYPIKPDRVKLNPLLTEVLVGFYEEFSKRKIEPKMDRTEEEVMVMADPSAIKRVLENLVINAIRHSSGEVAVQLEQTSSSVRLTVSNSVDRLSEADLAHLFDRFYKADQTRTGKGTGLGLPIAKSLMEKMNGSLTAEFVGDQLMMKCQWKRSK